MLFYFLGRNSKSQAICSRARLEISSGARTIRQKGKVLEGCWKSPVDIYSSALPTGGWILGRQSALPLNRQKERRKEGRREEDERKGGREEVRKRKKQGGKDKGRKERLKEKFKNTN